MERWVIDWLTVYENVGYWNIWYYPSFDLRDGIDHTLVIF